MQKRIKSVKAATMRLMGWSEKEYKKNYNAFGRQVRNYQRAIKSTRERNIAQTFYYTQKTLKQSKGDISALSVERQAILRMPKTASSVELSRRGKEIAAQSVYNRFEGLINANAGARKIYENNDLTLQQKIDKLKTYANRLNAKMSEDKKGVFPVAADIVGSDYVIDDDDI